MKSYKVEFEIISKHAFEVDASSPESAIIGAELLLEGCEVADITDREIISSDAYPLEETETES